VPVRIGAKYDYTGTVTPSALNAETTVVEVGAQSDDYIVEGWLDVSALASGDALVVTEYVAVDGTNYRVFAQVSLSGAQPFPVLRFHAKLLHKNMKYKATINQTAGTLRSFPYAFVVQVLEVF